MAEPSTDTAIRIEVLNDTSLDKFTSHWIKLVAPNAEQKLDKTSFRTAISLYGQVVYTAAGLLTPNPVRLGGLPCDCDLAMSILPPTALSLDESAKMQPLLTTATLTLRSMLASATHAPQESLPEALIWEGWLPLNVLEVRGVSMDWAKILDIRIQVSILFEEPLNERSLPATPVATQLSSSIFSEDWNERNFVKSQSYRLSTTAVQSEVDNTANSDERRYLRSGMEETIKIPMSANTQAGRSPLFPEMVQRVAEAYAALSPTSTVQDTLPVLSPPASPSPERSLQIASSRIASTTDLLATTTTSREKALQEENIYLREALARSQQETASSRSQHEEDRRRVQDKLRELEEEVRGHWQRRVAELEREIVLLRSKLGNGLASPQPIQCLPNRTLGFGAGRRASMPNGRGLMNQPHLPELERSQFLDSSPIEGPRFTMPSGRISSDSSFNAENVSGFDRFVPAWTPPGMGSPPIASLDPSCLTHMGNTDGKWQHNMSFMQQSEASSSSDKNAYPWLQQPPPRVGLGLQPPVGLNVPKLRFPTSMGHQMFNLNAINAPARDITSYANWVPDKAANGPQKDIQLRLPGLRTPPKKIEQDIDNHDSNSPSSEALEARGISSRPPSPPPPLARKDLQVAAMARQAPMYSPETPKQRARSLERLHYDVGRQFNPDLESAAATRATSARWREPNHGDAMIGREQERVLAPCRSRSDPTLPHLGAVRDNFGVGGFLNSFGVIYNQVYSAMQGKEHVVGMHSGTTSSSNFLA